jgi:nucleobase transporter 1/2
MSVTKVGSRRVVQTAGFLMMVLSLNAKVGAFFVAVPDPIIGGILCVTFAMIIAVGLSNLHNVDLTSSRNMFILGFSIFFAMVGHISLRVL